MADRPNFLLGHGERLTERIPAIRRPSRTPQPYTVSEARDRLVPMLDGAITEFDALPVAALPKDEAVAALTLHPQFLAKSYYPRALLRAVDLDVIGSRPTRITPQQWSRKGKPSESMSTELFVAASREAFRQWLSEMQAWRDSTPEANDLVRIEVFRAMRIEDRLRPIPETADEALLEIVLHAGPGRSDDYILDAFQALARTCQAQVDVDRRFYAGRLCFLPVRANKAVLRDLARFSYLRVARIMPSLRPLMPLTRGLAGASEFSCELPEKEAVDPSLCAAVFDGGARPQPALEKWVRPKAPPDIDAEIGEYVEHGMKVTSALLFGPLERGKPIDPPYATVDHYRVLDQKSGKSEDLFDVLSRIRSVLQENRYRFVNLSIGPEIPVEDGDVHVWTAVLDELLSDGNVLASIAVGNGGEGDEALGFNRIQVPADCVNGLSVGATSSQNGEWRRADYSSVGPGRSPGLVKPDILAFGGSESEPFWTIDPANSRRSICVNGTSFASPAALRLALGIRAHFGEQLSPLAIRGLLIHSSDPGSEDRHEVGWGFLANDLERLVICPNGTARVVYQGELAPRQYLRAPIPLPIEQLKGKVRIRATFCYASRTDPNHPGNYTRSGLEITFRPHDAKFDPKSEAAQQPKSEAFFRKKEYAFEQERRHDALKWETVLHQERAKRGSSLQNPVFDIHYNTREGGGPTDTKDAMRYALVITVSSPKTVDLYDRIVNRYQTHIQPLLPVIQIPIRTHGT